MKIWIKKCWLTESYKFDPHDKHILLLSTEWSDPHAYFAKGKRNGISERLKLFLTKLILYCSKEIRLHEFICIFLLCRFIHYSILWYILKENLISRSTRGESWGYDYCGRHSSSMNGIPPHFKSNKITVQVPSTTELS